eukprot:scaffold40119_cov38-Attheya_sp.AAC.2
MYQVYGCLQYPQWGSKTDGWIPYFGRSPPLYSHRPYVCPSLKGGAALRAPSGGDRGTDDG